MPLINYVESDSLLRSLVTMYCVRDTNNIILVPEVSGHVINIGNADGFENKFAKLKLFYREVMPVKGWNTYDTISVKWNHQIVATRRVKAIVQTIDIEHEDDELPPDMETTDLGVDPKANADKPAADKDQKDKDNKDKDKNGNTPDKDKKKN